MYKSARLRHLLRLAVLYGKPIGHVMTAVGSPGDIHLRPGSLGVDLIAAQNQLTDAHLRQDGILRIPFHQPAFPVLLGLGDAHRLLGRNLPSERQQEQQAQEQRHSPFHHVRYTFPFRIRGARSLTASRQRVGFCIDKKSHKSSDTPHYGRSYAVV